MALVTTVQKQIQGEGVSLLGPKAWSKLTLVLKILKQQLLLCMHKR